jgi:periplasmic protein TonB
VPAPPVPVKVPPVPLKPQPPAESTSDATTILSDKQVIDSPVSKPPPRYPQRALEADKEGVVRIQIKILPDGSVGDATVISAKPPGYFEQAALAAVKRWRYKASGRNITATVEVEFKLQ